MKQDPKKNLGDAIRAALQAAASQAAERPLDACGCMHCSGHTVDARVISANGLEVTLAFGTSTDEQEEVELRVMEGKGPIMAIRLSGDDKVSQFVASMKEMFA